MNNCIGYIRHLQNVNPEQSPRNIDWMLFHDILTIFFADYSRSLAPNFTHQWDKPHWFGYIIKEYTDSIPDLLNIQL